MRAQFVLTATFSTLTVLACGGNADNSTGEPTGGVRSDSDEPGDSVEPGDSDDNSELVEPIDAPPFGEGPLAGNSEGKCSVPSDATLEDVSHPDVVVGDGTKESCTGQKVVDAVAAGGVITFDCGPEPVTITLDQPAKCSTTATRWSPLTVGG